MGGRVGEAGGPVGRRIAATGLAAVLAGALVLGGIGLAGCRRGEQEGEALWSRPAWEGLPDEVAEWVTNSLTIDAGQWRTVGDRTYVLRTLGFRPGGDRLVEILGVERAAPGSNAVTVTLRYTTPPAGTGSSGQGGSGGAGPVGGEHPYDLVAVNFPGAEVTWAVEGDPDAYVMGVYGDIRAIVAESAGIKLFGPAPGSAVSSPLILEGLANVFEGQVDYRLLGAGGVVLARGYAMGMMGDWGGFSVEVAFAVPPGTPMNEAGEVEAVLEVFWYSPMDGSETDKIVVPLRLRLGG